MARSNAFNPVQSAIANAAIQVSTQLSRPKAAQAVAIALSPKQDIAHEFAEFKLKNHLAASVDWSQLEALGFEAELHSTAVLPGSPTVVLVGRGDAAVSAADVRDMAAAASRAASNVDALAMNLHQFTAGRIADVDDAEAEMFALAAIEGALLARYAYKGVKSEFTDRSLRELQLIVGKSQLAAAKRAISVATELVRATALARDLINTPPKLLSAEIFADTIAELAPSFGLKATVYDRKALQRMGCGGVLGVNAGSVEEPRVVQLSYSPQKPASHLALVGKGIMYDSGGISLKPSNPSHTNMKMDMSGAAAVFAAMSTLRANGVRNKVTGFLMLTDNMPSGSATKLGDVLTIRGGTTVEVKNTDAEGRLVLADGLTLATEEKPDAIVDIATLTGVAMLALGLKNAAVFANNDGILAQVQRAAVETDETVWQMPLDHRYRKSLKSEVADLQNMGGEYGGAINAALFLNEFVGDVPWAHIDMAPTMRAEADSLWQSVGATAYGTRLLATLAKNFARE